MISPNRPFDCSLPATSQTKRPAGLRQRSVVGQAMVWGAFLLVPLVGCHSSPKSVDPVEIGDVWRQGNMVSQRHEACYRQAWRLGYCDGKIGVAACSPQTAVFESYQGQLRAESIQQWQRGYDDGYASGKSHAQSADPHGLHQQAFQIPADSADAAPGFPDTTAPDFPEATAPNAPVAPAPETTTPETTAPEAPAPDAPQKKYIDKDRIASDWELLNSAIRNSVTDHQSNPSALPVVVVSPAPVSQFVPATSVSHPQTQPAAITLGPPADSPWGNPSPSASGPTLPVTSEQQITLPSIDVQQTFGQNRYPVLEAQAPTTQPVMDLELPKDSLKQPAANPSSDQEEARELNLDFGQYPVTPNQALSQRQLQIANSDSTTRLRTWALPALESQADDSAVAKSEQGALNHQAPLQTVDFQTMEPGFPVPPATNLLPLPSRLPAPASPLLTPRQRIRNQLPSRLPLKLRHPNR